MMHKPSHLDRRLLQQQTVSDIVGHHHYLVPANTCLVLHVTFLLFMSHPFIKAFQHGLYQSFFVKGVILLFVGFRLLFPLHTRNGAPQGINRHC